MKENLLQFIWKLKLFSMHKLESTAGEKIQIISVGNENLNAGPDFLNAKIKINNQLWVGNVELHIQASDWYAHHHEIDKRYDSVILHIVWNHDVDVFRKNNSPVSTLELKTYVAKELLMSYENLFHKPIKWIQCESLIYGVNNFVISNWLNRLFFERLEQKAMYINSLLKKTNQNWEATLFMLLAKNFGLKVNADAFYMMASSFDFSVVRKVSFDIHQLEALLFGQSGLLNSDAECAYYNKLKNEYQFLKRKFNLNEPLTNNMQFFRLRPSNFPTIRLSQLAMLYKKQHHLFSQIIDVNSVSDFYKILNVSTSSFWETHYTFERESKKSIKKLSKAFVDLLLINTILPIKFLYLKSIETTNYTSVISVFEELKPEKNAIITNFNNLKINSKTALETQALLQLKNEYCNKQRCLDCAIGKEVLKN